MADDVQVGIKITGDSKAAVKEIDKAAKSLDAVSKSAVEANESLSENNKTTEETSEANKDAAKSTEDFAEEVLELSQKVEQSESSLMRMSKALDNFEKSAKKLGRDLTTLVTAPIAALAGISLKNLYDLGKIADGSGPTSDFARSVDRLRSTFNQLSLEIGSKLAPAFTSLADSMTSMINKYRSLNEGTKTFITSISLFLAILGPTTLALSSIAGLFSKLIPLFISIGKVIAPVVKSIGSIARALISIKAVAILSIGGLVNLFLDLKKSGVGTVDSITKAFMYLVNGLNAKIIAPLMDGLSFLISGLSKVAGLVNKSVGKSLDEAAKSVSGFSQRLRKGFEDSTNDINSNLEKIGKNAAGSFTLGLTDGINSAGGFLSNLFGDSKSAAEEIKKSVAPVNLELLRLKEEHNLEIERMEKDHQLAMKSISSQDNESLENERLQKQIEFSEKSYQIKKNALDREYQEELNQINKITNEAEKLAAKREAIKNKELADEQLINAKEIEITQATNQQLEALQTQRYEKIKGYADMFSQGLTDGFLSIAEGTVSAGEAMEKFAKDFIKQVTAMILKQTILNATMRAMSSFGFAEGGPVGSFATGGPVRGAGTGTSDSIPAWLSNGEYVIRAGAAKKLGLNFLNNLNSIDKMGPSPFLSAPNKFANGGAVSGGGAAQVVIQNSGQPKEVTSSTYDPATAVTTVVLEDISRNGPISKSLSGNYGLKRGGFR